MRATPPGHPDAKTSSGSEIAWMQRADGLRGGDDLVVTGPPASMLVWLRA